MASDTKYLWVFTYAIEDDKYACPFYFESQQAAEARINRILSYSKHIKQISLQEQKEGYDFNGMYLPYVEEKRDPNWKWEQQWR